MPALPRISIVVPSFNQGDYLSSCLTSLIAQHYPNLEILVIDGASTDDTFAVIQRWQAHLSYWVSEPDNGQSEAINKGFARCTGDLITFQGSDDFYFPGALWDAAEAFMRQPNCGAIVGAFQRCDELSTPVGDPVSPMLAQPAPLDLTLGPPGIYRLHQTATFFTRRTLDVVGRHVDNTLHYVMDRELLYRVCRHAPVVLSQRCYAGFRAHPGSKSVNAILPFAREFAALYLRSLNGNPIEDRLRCAMARHRITSGYLKAAAARADRLRAIGYLICALRSDLRLLLQRRYAAAWAKAMLGGVFKP